MGKGSICSRLPGLAQPRAAAAWSFQRLVRSFSLFFFLIIFLRLDDFSVWVVPFFFFFVIFFLVGWLLGFFPSGFVCSALQWGF